MGHQNLLATANAAMVCTLLLFITSVVLAYAFDQSFSMLTLTFLHISQIILAASFKLSYVLRLVAQDKLGLALR
jgi:hypothetical protein